MDEFNLFNSDNFVILFTFFSIKSISILFDDFFKIKLIRFKWDGIFFSPIKFKLYKLFLLCKGLQEFALLLWLNIEIELLLNLFIKYNFFV